ncbi:Stealth CR1 domain-containing protein [Latilactobacillus sakei]|uniref:Stealth CR1 domain-containing protein n=1 Tax=Latilactobacillus sakei TaxID=1599 RepID=UPI0015F6B01A|nr:Stealth CR1 domain-containing protein [Latilactobacillus sakei]QMU87142.1 Stealth CR1 domain-containing protein [Latilactobacillus sakei]
MNFKIDIVVSWVNSNDRIWQERMNKQLQLMGKEQLMIDEARYHDFGFFKYWFRSIEKFAPWVNHVYVLTDNQEPKFFYGSDKVTIIDHTEVIPYEYLPTFSSSVIELFLDKIPGISEHFIYFNDDMFLNNPVSPVDFFDSKGLPKDCAIPSVLQPVSDFDHLPFNDISVINKNFPKRKVMKEYGRNFFSLKYGFANIFKSILTLPFSNWSTFKIQHIPYSLRKEDYRLLRKYAENEIENTAKMHFRSNNDINIWLLLELRFVTGKFSPRSVKEGKYYNFDDTDSLIECLNNSKVKMICINDDSSCKTLSEKIVEAERIEKSLEEKFPSKALVEMEEV